MDVGCGGGGVGLFFFFFNDTATTEIYTLSLHDALPICGAQVRALRHPCGIRLTVVERRLVIAEPSLPLLKGRR